MTFDEPEVVAAILADFESERIEGYIPDKGQRLEVSLLSKITPELYMGGYPGMIRTADLSVFGLIVDMYGEAYKVPLDVVHVRAPMHDWAEETIDEPRLRALATLVNAGRKFPRPVYVHCQAGLNRSGLLVAYSLMLHGVPPELAIEMLRLSRSELVLCNKTFEDWLLAR